MTIYKYSGAGNDFVVLDGRREDVGRYRSEGLISSLCDRSSGLQIASERRGADGLMILSESGELDFRMEYYNSDGSGGMMCGNGGRCIVAFADHLGIRPGACGSYRFEAPDGEHTAEILSKDGTVSTVKLAMKDAVEYRRVLNGWFVDTGTRHYVEFVPDARRVDVDGLGARYRHNPVFAPQGANANFVSLDPDGAIRVRTFEKGVEAETLACGTGITSSVLAAYLEGVVPSDGSYVVRALRDTLGVSFRKPAFAGEAFTEVYLTGPAELIAEKQVA